MRSGIEQLRFVEGALRDGLLYDMVGRMTRSDARERTVASMQRRYHVDLEQCRRASRPRRCSFYRRCAGAGDSTDPLAELSLRWAARLHEIGLDVAHNGYHRHGAYLLENADMPGFAREEQQLIARLVGCIGASSRSRARGSDSAVGPAGDPPDRAAAPGGAAASRPQRRGRCPNIELTPRGRTLELRFPARWLQEHPLTVADLQLEIDFLRPQGVRLRVFSGNRAN